MSYSIHDTENIFQVALKLTRNFISIFAKLRASDGKKASDHKLVPLFFRVKSILHLKLYETHKNQLKKNLSFIELNEIITNVITIDTAAYSTIKNQIKILEDLETAHDLWLQAEDLAKKQMCKEFFAQLDASQPISLSSSTDSVCDYIKTALQLLNAQEF